MPHLTWNDPCMGFYREVWVFYWRVWVFMRKYGFLLKVWVLWASMGSYGQVWISILNNIFVFKV